MAEQKNKKVEEQIDNTPIDGQMEIAPEDTAELKLKVADGTADTLVAEMPDGEIVEINKESLTVKEETDNCADHISRTKVLDVINSTMAKYEGKVVLAMSEVRDIIKAITTAVNE
jgi:hypothetical protein